MRPGQQSPRKSGQEGEGAIAEYGFNEAGATIAPEMASGNTGNYAEFGLQ